MPGTIDLAAIAAIVCKQRNGVVIEELGAGAHKRAYLFEQNGAQLALKIAPITPSLKPRFEREASALSGCSHSAVAILHESFSLIADGQEYWVSLEEYLAGGTLAKKLAAGAMEAADVRQRDLPLAVARIARREPLPSRVKDSLLAAGFGNLLKALAPWPVQRYRAPPDFIAALLKE